MNSSRPCLPAKRGGGYGIPSPQHRDPFATEAVRISAATDPSTNVKLAQFLRSTRLDVTELEMHGAMDAWFAQVSQNSLAFVSTPPFSTTWRRGAASKTQAIMLFARKGELDASSTSPVIRRGRNALLIPPGDGPLTIRGTRTHNEFIFVSTGAQMFPPEVAGLRHDIDAPPLPWRRIAALYAFSRSLCIMPPRQAEADALTQATDVIVQAFAQSAFVDIALEGGVLDQARAFIASNHQNPSVTASTVAQHLRLHIRTVQAAFAAEDLTVQAELRRARTKTAIRLGHEHPALTRQQQAELAGFASISAFYRAVKSERDARGPGGIAPERLEDEGTRKLTENEQKGGPGA